MTNDTFVMLAKYNRAANEAMGRVIKTLDADAWDKQFPAFFKSVRELCSHIYIADFVWLKRFEGLREFKTLQGEFFTQSFSFKDVLFADKNDYLAKRPELDAKLEAFVNELTDGDLQKSLSYKDSGGNPHEQNFGGLLLHTFNHAVHHRGMISFCLELLGKDNDYNSLVQVL
ncbi:diguanylate cyclase [Spirochaetia bacterium]|nr:diguanylate cyclase [Spirochaetia bacterium]